MGAKYLVPDLRLRQVIRKEGDWQNPASLGLIFCDNHRHVGRLIFSFKVLGQIEAKASSRIICHMTGGGNGVGM